MNTKHFIGLSMICAGLIFLACQKDDLAKPGNLSNDPVKPRAAAVNCSSGLTTVYPTVVCAGENFTLSTVGTCGRWKIQETTTGAACNTPDGPTSGWVDLNGNFACATATPYSYTTTTPRPAGVYSFRTIHLQSVPGGPQGDGCGSACTTFSGEQWCCFTVTVLQCGETCYETETAWADGTRYQNPGNWATYTAYDATNGTTATLYAGQTMDAGTVDFAPCVGGEVEITITLNDGWSFNPDKAPNTLSIQGYSSAPSGNPAPGQFDHQFNANSSPYVVTVPCANYFGVHADVRVEVECPE